MDRPLGVGSGEAPTTTLTLEPGAGLVLYSDGLVDSRETSLRDGLRRLRVQFDRSGGRTVDIDDVIEECRDPASVDDITLLLLCRDK